MSFKASLSLARATREALQVFARHKPTIFRLANEDSEASDAFVNDYARGLLGVTLEVIPEAAQRWVATKTEIASPATFGMFARAIDVAEYRTPVFEPVAAPVSAPVDHLKNRARIDALGRRAFETVESWRAVSEIWALLWDTAPTDDLRLQIRKGDVDDDVFDEAITAYQRGVRAADGPLSTSVNAVVGRR